MLRLRPLLSVIAAGLALAHQPARASTILDLKSAGNTETRAAAIGGDFTVVQGSIQPSGTGVFQPFVRIQANGNETSEDGYNTDNGTPLDDKGGVWTHALLSSDIPTVTIGTTVFRQFRLDGADPQNGDNRYLSLNQIQIFQAGIDPGPSDFTLTDPTLTTPPIIAFNLSVGATEVFRMNDAVSSFFEIQLNTGLSHGNGSSDMYLYVADSVFKPQYGDNVIFYTMFGADNFGDDKDPNYGPGQYLADGSFEEWGAGESSLGIAAVPEPSTFVSAGIAGVMGLGYGWRRRRKAKLAA